MVRSVLVALVVAVLVVAGAAPGSADFRIFSTTDGGTKGGVMTWEAESDNYMKVCDRDNDGLRVVGYLRYRSAGVNRTLFIQALGQGRCTYTNFSVRANKAVQVQVCLKDGDGSGIARSCSAPFTDYTT